MICLLHLIVIVLKDSEGKLKFKKMICRNHVIFMLCDVFGFAEHEQKATNRLGFRESLTRNSNVAVWKKGLGIPDHRNVINNIHWYVLHYTPIYLNKLN